MSSCRHLLCEASRECQIGSAEDLIAAISAAIHACDAPAVEALLKRLALTDPVQAQIVLDTIELGLAMASAREPATHSQSFPR